jgi:DNA polymerase-3 subunit gamma/tau
LLSSLRDFTQPWQLARSGCIRDNLIDVFPPCSPDRSPAMSYLALARKWRPRRFEDVRGQAHVVTALRHALDNDRLHPAILLTGTRGVGKTTLARIIAKGLNCDTGVSANPCGVCISCKEVNDGRFVDLLEIDAASNTGVDDVRQLIDNAQYAPARGRYKVYLIDEVHMLSKQAFNALLKTLEEPPPYVKFILATTDPQKLLVTVLSRCLQFNLKRLPQALIRDALADILKQEGIEAETAALAEIARAADGSMRDGLSLLDQAIAFASGAALTREGVEAMLGTGTRRNLFALLDALARGDGPALIEGIQRLDETAPDYAGLINDLAATLQRIAVLQILPTAGDEDDDPALLPLAKAITPEDAQLWYQTAVLGRRDLPWAPDPRLGFEMTLLRMFAFRPDEGGGAVSGGGRASAATTKPLASGAAVVAKAVLRRPTAVTPVPAPTLLSTRSPDVEPAPEPAPGIAEPVVAVPPPAVTRRNLESVEGSSWAERIETLGLDGMTRQFARHCAWLGLADGVLRLAIDLRAKHLLTDERRMLLMRALEPQFGAVKIEVAIGVPDDALSPAASDDKRVVDRQRAAESAIEADPVVRSFKATFGATVRPGSVKPIEPPTE